MAKQIPSLVTTILPIVYIAGLLTVLVVVGRFIKSKSKSKEQGYFPPHTQKLEYLELAEQYPLDDKYGRQVLIEALMARAVESVRRVVRIRDEKPSLSQMVSTGMIGGQLLDKLNAAEIEIAKELEEVLIIDPVKI